MPSVPCPKCAFENPDGFGFCGQCGDKLNPGCPSCGVQIIPGFKFCGNCGYSLNTNDQDSPAMSPQPETNTTDQNLAPTHSEQPTTAEAQTVTTSQQEFANGRYRSIKFLGEGGKKKVYLAYDSLLDREVAFALIKTEGLDEQGRTRITREAQAMGRLGAHGSIVTVFDLGEHNEQPYMVTELMGGGDVEGMIEKAENNRIPIENTLRIAIQICHGLQFAHDRGIIHRDLKPGNVWLTSDGDAKIGDFGLAVATDRSRLTQVGMMVGTVAYMPPEQAMGGEITPRADLYALGAMLYEMITGRPPFMADDPLGIISQHINTAPVAPTWHNGNCPKTLESLILRLLAKSSSDRPESAADVLNALQGIELTGETQQAIASNGDEPQNQALDAMAGGVFVGRQKEMGELKAGLEDALSGRGRLMTLVGEPGIGKTRTSQELATYATLRGAQVLWGRCYDSQGVPPYWPWVQAIRSYVHDRDTEHLRSVMGSGASDIAEIVGDIRTRLGDLEKLPDMDPEQARFRLFDSTTNFLRNSSRNQPIVLFLDDLHWADKPSLLLLEFIASELAGSRLLIVGTYRDVELSRQHPLAETLGELTRDRLFQRVLLRGLGAEDISRFIEATTNVKPPTQLVDSVYTQTEGNPLFVTEVVRLLVQEGELTPDKVGQRDSWSVRIPEGVREVIGRRLNRLSERCNQILTTAAVIGREFELQQLSKLNTDLSQDRLIETIEEALSARVIEELPQTVGRYQFTHALIQETLSEELSITRRVRLHGEIAEALEDMYGPRVEEHASELAFHYSQAETVLGTDKLILYSSLAGQQAISAFAFEEAANHLSRALTAIENESSSSQILSGKHAEILAGLGQSHIGGGNNVEGWSHLARAFEYYKSISNTEKCLEIGELYCLPSVRGPHTVVAEAVQMAPPGSMIRGRLLSFHGRFQGFAGRYDEAIISLDEANAIADNFGAKQLQLAIQVNRGMSLNFSLDIARSTQSAQLAFAIAEDPSLETDDSVLGAYAQMAGAWFNSGKGLQKAKDINSQAQSIAGRARGRFALDGLQGAKINLAIAEANWNEAESTADHMVEIAPYNTGIRAGRAYIQYLVGDFVKGAHYLEEMIDVASKANLGPQAATLNACLVIVRAAEITRSHDNLGRAEALIQKVINQTDVAPLYAIMAKYLQAQIAVLAGRTENAQDYIDALLPYSGEIIRPYHLCVDEILGGLYGLIGDFVSAKTHFQQALDYWSDEYKVNILRIQLEYADLLEQTQNADDRILASDLIDKAQQIARQIDARPYLEHALSKRDILKA